MTAPYNDAGDWFNPSDPRVRHDRYRAFARLRREAPVFYHETLKLWFISRYEDIASLLTDKRLGRSMSQVLPKREHPDFRDDGSNNRYPCFERYVQSGFIEKEGPDHTRLRKLVHAVFTPRRVDNLRTRVETITADLLTTAMAGGEADFLEDFATPLPVVVIAELLGVPEADRHRLRPWSRDIVGVFDLDGGRSAWQRAETATEAFAGYLLDLSTKRSEQPTDDLISALVSVEEDGDRLTRDELIATCILLLNAGHEATVNAAGNGMLALFRHPDQWRALRENPDLIPSAVEEMLRYDSPLQMFKRWVLEDFEYQGHSLRQGSQVALLFASANRDESRFDNASTFDIDRRDNPHLAFGKGMHFCIGAPLARMELQVTFSTLLRRAPRITLLSDSPRYRDSFVFRGLEALPVRFR
jgi:cytochrome P450